MGKRAKAVELEAPPLPANVDELADFLRQTGEVWREMNVINDRINRLVERATQRVAGKLSELEKKRLDLATGIYLYVQKNHDEVMKNKTVVKLLTGELEQSYGPPAIAEIDEEEEEEKIEMLIRTGHEDCVRYGEPELDKVALLKNQELAKLLGFDIIQRLFFYLKPSGFSESLRIEVKEEADSGKKISLKEEDRAKEAEKERKRLERERKNAEKEREKAERKARKQPA